MTGNLKCLGGKHNIFESSFSSSSGSVGWGADQSVGGFGDEPGVKAQLMNLVRSVRTVMRGDWLSHDNHTGLHTVYKMFWSCSSVLLPHSATNRGKFSLHRAAASVWMKKSGRSKCSAGCPWPQEPQWRNLSRHPIHSDSDLLFLI